MLTPDTTQEYLKLNLPMHGNKVIVVPFNAETHLDGLWAAQTEYKNELADPNQDLIWTYMPYGPFDSKEAFLANVQAIINRATATSKAFVFVVQLSEGHPTHPNKIIGFVASINILPAHRSCEIACVWLDPRFRRQGLLDEAVYLMTKQAIEVAGYRRVEWKCNANNSASQKMAERNQFVFEGIHRNCWIVKGKNRDTAWFSVIDSEWKDVKSV